MQIFRIVFFSGLLLIYTSKVYCQHYQLTPNDKVRRLDTAVPFLLINPDARLGGMGDAGMALGKDNNALASNPSKIAYIDYISGLSLSYSPRMKSLADNISLLYGSGIYKLNNNTFIGSSIRYISLGEFELTDSDSQPLGVFSPNEVAADVTYAKRFGESFSLGTTVRYIYSGLEKANIYDNSQPGSGSSFAVDISALYTNNTILLGKDAIVSFGANVSNIGTKIGNSSNGSKEFIPTMLKLGTAGSFIVDDFNMLSFAVDLSKLLVPSSPLVDLNGKIVSGKNPDRSVPAGIFGSFNDAPGGVSEELKEINIAVGAEYEYNSAFAIRAGYYYQNPLKGFNRYFTTGMGLKYNEFNIDLAYVVGKPQNNILANTLRFSLFYKIK